MFALCFVCYRLFLFLWLGFRPVVRTGALLLWKSRGEHSRDVFSKLYSDRSELVSLKEKYKLAEYLGKRFVYSSFVSLRFRIVFDSSGAPGVQTRTVSLASRNSYCLEYSYRSIKS